MSKRHTTPLTCGNIHCRSDMKRRPPRDSLQGSCKVVHSRRRPDKEHTTTAGASTLQGMSDFFRDPNHPDRPQSQDYWRLVDVVNRLDGYAAESNRTVEDIAREMVDPEALTYMAFQRGLRMEMATDGAVPAIAVAPIWLEAFLAGIAFQQAGGHRDG